MIIDDYCPHCNQSTAPSAGGCDCTPKTLGQEMAEWEAMGLADWRNFLDDLEEEE